MFCSIACNTADFNESKLKSWKQLAENWLCLQPQIIWPPNLTRELKCLPDPSLLYGIALLELEIALVMVMFPTFLRSCLTLLSIWMVIFRPKCRKGVHIILHSSGSFAVHPSHHQQQDIRLIPSQPVELSRHERRWWHYTLQDDKLMAICYHIFKFLIAENQMKLDWTCFWELMLVFFF